jgi:hypothetical protein
MHNGLNRTLHSEEGSMMVIALLILVILTLIGATVATTTRIEIQIAGNERFHNIAFHLADSGTMVAPKVVSTCLECSSEVDIPGVTYLGTSGAFYRELMGYAPHDAERDLRFGLSGYSVDVDVRRIGQVNLAGRGAEFASGAEGVGVGSTGGVAILYEIDSEAPGPSASLSNVSAIYRKIVGLAGGL